MKPFNHVDATTVKKAVTLLKKNQGKAKLIAGGTDLLSTLKDKILPTYLETVINIKTIPDLNHISEHADGLKLGALAKLETIAQSPLIKEKYKLLAEAAEAVATPQIRRMGTIGGNLCQGVRCWYYRYPHSVGGRILCYLKGGKGCYALTGENEYHSIFGGWRDAGPPCASACPGGVDIPSYISRIREENLIEAARTLLETNPLPSITGRVCPHFCEQACNRGEFDEAVSIRDIERFMGDYILDTPDDVITSPEADSGKSVAIVGSGPAGLSAAYYLAKLGHSVTVFEALPKPGGMMRIGIPDYRLPKDILDAQIKKIQQLGVDIKLNISIQSIDSLFEQGYDAIFLALGAHRIAKLGIKGEELPGVRDGMSLLKAVNAGERVSLGDRAAVIGGGNTAIDSARTALRLGTKEVTVFYRRTRAEMPAGEDEIEEALADGVRLNFLAAPIEIDGDDSRLKLTCNRMELGEPDAGGRRRPLPIKGSEFHQEFDTIIAAIGQDPDIPSQFGLMTSREHTLTVDPVTQATDRPGVWAGGDVVTGPATVIEAIATGRRAASAIDVYLTEEATAEDEGKKTAEPFLRFNSNYLKKTHRVQMPKRPVAERSIAVEDNIGLGFSEIEAEANRCFNCSCVSVSPSDMGLVLVALEARVEIAGPGGTRTVPIEDFFGSLRTTLTADEMVTHIQVPQPPDGARQTFLKFRLRESVDFPIVSVASVITVEDGICQDARIVLGAVAPAPVRAAGAEKVLIGRAIDDGQATAAARAALEGAIPLGKNSYKVTVARELVRRAILRPESPGDMR